MTVKALIAAAYLAAFFGMIVAGILLPHASNERHDDDQA